MLTTFGQYIGGKVVTSILAALLIGGGIWFWNHPEQLATIWRTLQYVLVWLGITVALPWATFFVTPWVVSKDSNAAAGLMLLGYTVADFVVAWWLIGSLRGLGTLSWMVLLLGFLAAAVYNFKVCEYQAQQAEGGY
ncbi:MAG: hypothetical protein HY763_17110 [Planctomycetes bacterium]|nr:hypothetical protein [Planctomycetota bacterium]